MELHKGREGDQGKGGDRMFSGMRTAFVLPYLLLGWTNPRFAADLILLGGFPLKHLRVKAEG